VKKVKAKTVNANMKKNDDNQWWRWRRAWRAAKREK